VVGVVADLLANGMALIGFERTREGDLLDFDVMIEGLVDVEVEVAFLGEAVG
jgi:hypothetical protein